MSADYASSVKKLNQFFPAIEINEKDMAIFAKKVSGRLYADPNAKLVIDKLLKTDKTFMNSLGYISDYLRDVSYCRQCQKSLSRCPKNGKGWQRTPYYDPFFDEIRLSPRPCSYREENTRILDAIYPCSYPSNLIYKEACHRIDICKANSGILAETKEALVGIISDLRIAKPSAEGCGSCFFASNDKAIPFSLLCVAAYFAGRAARKVAFLETKDFFFRLRSSDSLTKHNAVSDFHKACDLPVLILSEFDLYPYGNAEFQSTYLAPLLLSRREAGKLTYFSLSKSDTLVSVIRRILRQNDGKQEILDWAENSILSVSVHDLPL